MKFKKSSGLSCLAAALAAVFSANGAEKFVWEEGHGDIAANFINGTWEWSVEEGKAVEEVVIRIRDNARNAIPDLTEYAFLGATGDPIWIIPASQEDGIPFLGINAGATAAGTFVNDRFDLSLNSVTGPGDFFMWTATPTGAPTILMNSRDGITAADKTDVPAGGHLHQNWGFSSPGTYLLGFKAAGILVGQSAPTNSAEAIFTFEANVLKAGEADIEVAYEEGELHLHLHDEVADVEHEPAHVALQAGARSWRTVPQGAAFSFLGSPGASVYVLPQEETEGVLYLGLAAGEVTAGVFANDRLTLKLLDVEGPGEIAYYELNQFGAPTVYLNSADGISASDAVTVQVGAHAHRNWSFTEPGTYRVTLQASGTLTSGGEVNSEPETFLFEVLPPLFASSGELDFEAAFEDDALVLGFHDHATERAVAPDDVVLVVNAAAKQTIPSNSTFSFLGTPGADIYVLPQDETEGLLFLGIAGEEIPDATFANNRVSLELVSAQGPGDFVLYSVSSFGDAAVYMNSRDGVTSSDVFNIPAESHSHVNWAFSTPGEYRLGFKVSGTLTGTNQPITSESVTLRFIVRQSVSGPELNISINDNPRQLLITWQGRAGVTYQLQSRTALDGGAWTDVGSAIPGQAAAQSAVAEIGADAFRIFRLVANQP